MGGPGSGRRPSELVITQHLLAQLQEHPSDNPVRTTKAGQIAADLIATARSEKDPCRFKAIEEILLRVEGPIVADWPGITMERGVFNFSNFSDAALDDLVKTMQQLQPEPKQLPPVGCDREYPRGD